MKGFLVGLGLVVLVLIIVVFLFVMGILGRGCSTASQMADKTVFNASQNVYSYENFYNLFEKHTMYVKMIEDADKRLPTLDPKGQDYQNISMQRTGAAQMKLQIEAEYNKASKVFYQKIWKGKGLPEILE